MYIQTSVTNNKPTTTIVMSDGESHIITDPPTIVSINALMLNSHSLGLEQLESCVRQIVESAVNPKEEFTKELSAISDLISLRDNKFYWADEPMPKTIDTYLGHVWKEHQESAKDITPIILFLEDLYKNVDPNVREQLFGWLTSNFCNNGVMQLTDDGRIVGYKGVQMSGHIPHSISRGHAFVSINGGRTKTKYLGQIPYPLGSIATMDRDDVENNPSIGCSQGLHVGNLSYATGFGRGNVITVAVYPRHVVSVPTECDQQKLRCCEFQVISLGVDDDSTIVQVNIPEECIPKREPRDTFSFTDEDDFYCCDECNDVGCDN